MPRGFPVADRGYRPEPGAARMGRADLRGSEVAGARLGRAGDAAVGPVGGLWRGAGPALGGGPPVSDAPARRRDIQEALSAPQEGAAPIGHRSPPGMWDMPPPAPMGEPGATPAPGFLPEDWDEVVRPARPDPGAGGREHRAPARDGAGRSRLSRNLPGQRGTGGHGAAAGRCASAAEQAAGAGMARARGTRPGANLSTTTGWRADRSRKITRGRRPIPTNWSSCPTASGFRKPSCPMSNGARNGAGWGVSWKPNGTTY